MTNFTIHSVLYFFVTVYVASSIICFCGSIFSIFHVFLSIELFWLLDVQEILLLCTDYLLCTSEQSINVNYL